VAAPGLPGAADLKAEGGHENHRRRSFQGLAISAKSTSIASRRYRCPGGARVLRIGWSDRSRRSTRGPMTPERRSAARTAEWSAALERGAMVVLACVCPGTAGVEW